MSSAPRDLKTMNDALLAENADLRRQIAALTGQLAAMTAQIAALTDRVNELLAVALQKRRPPPVLAKAPEPPPTLNEAQRLAFENRPKAAPLPEKPEVPKKPRKPTGRRAIPEHLVAEEHECRPDACPECGGTAFEWVDKVVETKLHVVASHQRRRIVERPTGCCKHCGTRVTAPSLPSPFARSKATCEWLAWLIHQKFSLLLPLDRIRRDLIAKGLPLAMSYFVSQIERAADILGCIDGEHWKDLLAGNWMATDATSLKVLISGLPGSHSGHLEVYRRKELVVFQYEATKDSETLGSKLKPFKGILVADAEHRHNIVFADGSVQEAGCNAHGRRKFEDAEAVQPALAAEGGAFIASMYVAEAEAREKRLTGDALRDWRQQQVPPIQADLRAWMDAIEPTLTPDDPLARVIRYYRNHWQALFRFVDHPEIPIDNSASEREFQTVAKMRLNALFAGSTEGAHRMATLLGIVATCRAQGIDPEAYLAWVFTRLGTHRDVYNLPAADLTPTAYRRAQG